LKKKGFKEERATKVGWYDLGEPTTLESNKSQAEMVQRIAEETGCTSAQAAKAVTAILAVIKADLQQGGAVSLRRFGTFHVRAKRARVGRNPKTGDAAAMAARRVVRFTAGATLKQRVEGAVTARA
jgi:nucleoid DNA-binding protein